MDLKKLLATFAFALVILLTGCAKDEVVEIVGVCPVVLSTVPDDGAINVPLDQVITVTFNEEVDPQTINEETFTVDGPTQLVGTVTSSGATASFTPSADLAPNTIYTGMVTTSVKDPLGNALQENYVWTFTTIPEVTLTASPEEGGTVTGAGTFAKETLVTVAAIPNDGFTFTNWTEGETVVSTSSSYQFEMDGNIALVANFEEVVLGNFRINLSSSPSAGGTTTGSGQFSANSTVTVAALPNPGYVFVNWTEGETIASTSSSYQFVLTANRTLVANYSLVLENQFAVILSANPAAGGLTNGSGSFDAETNVTVTATPNAGYAFVNWTANGEEVSTNSSYTFAITANTNLVANFEVSTYTLNVTAENGSVSKVPNEQNYNSGAEVVLNATPNDGYVFSSWSGDASGSENPLTLTMNEDKNITANFTLIESSFTLNVTAEHGTVTKTPDQQNYNDGAEVVLNATPNDGYVFSSWSGDASGSENPLTLTMNEDKNITANFTLIESGFTLNVTAENGSVSKNPDQATYTHGTTVELTATPATGFEFTSWSGDATGSNNPLTVTMNSNKNITANFTAIVSTFTLNVTAENGTVAKDPNQQNYNSGDEVVLTATPATGYEFTSWSGDATGSNNPLTVTMNANKNITANFTLIPVSTFTLNVTAENGTVAKDPNQQNYNSGDEVVLTATPATGYEFTSWSGDATGSNNPLTVVMNSNKNITANFTLTSSAVGPGIIDLGKAGEFVILSKSGIDRIGVTSIIGNIGVSPIGQTALTGFSQSMDVSNTFSTSDYVKGKLYAADYTTPTPAYLTTAISDMETALTTANGLTTDVIVALGAGDISGMTLAPGLYKWDTGLLITNAGVTLSGGPDDTWVFQISKDFTIDNDAKITLAGGAQAKNIFWVTKTQAVLGSNVQFKGNVLAGTLISVNTGTAVVGRLLSQKAVTLKTNTVTKP